MSDCTRWIALSDCDAVGEAITEGESAFLLSHAQVCRECGQERDLWRSLEPATGSPAIVPDRVDPPAPPNRARPGRRVLATIVAAAAAALVIFATRFATRTSDRNVAAPADPQRGAHVGFASGDVDVDGHDPVLGAPLARGAVVATRAGNACLVVSDGVRACLAPASRVRVVQAVAPHRLLEVLVGKVVAELDPQPQGTTFTLQTRDGSATAIGTSFSVEVSENGGTSITRVLHGTVLVRGRDVLERRVGAHAQVAMTAAQVGPAVAADELHDMMVLVPSMESSEKEPSLVRIDSDPRGAAVRIDERPVGKTPLAILVEAGEHAVVVETENARSRDVMSLAPGEHLDRRFALRAASFERSVTAAAPEVAPATPSPASAGGPVALLRAARAASARSDFAAAAASYRALLAGYPRSPEAVASELAYGELQLGPLADPHGALRTFDRYVAHGGPLAEEAAYGRIRALRALGRESAERSAIDAFLLAYPNGAAAVALRKRARDTEVPR